ncbi:hypothetical protein [Thioalkalivibrio sp. AKL7]|uniref:hypothetical protein n=1 Tax=Thioalkalivibrio sp. AKL7 TaxID=1158155 RepID=UPI0003779251|nr:hypothetical protein [Thioalkalivibrio sp. AKL7]
MPSVDQVRPKMWDDVIDLYDDGSYSAIWGRREEAPKRSLGVRWNGADGYAGYPNLGKNPVWYSEPTFLQHAILSALLEKVKKMQEHPRREEFLRNVLTALEEC